MHIKKNISWALACFIPFVFYLLGFKNFIAAISFTGAITLGVAAILLIIMYFKAKKEGDKAPAYELALPHIVIYLIAALFFLGVVYQVWYFLA